MEFAGVVAALLMASSCDNTVGCNEIIVAPFHGPAGKSLCQIAASTFNRENSYTVVTGNTRPIVFMCKEPPSRGNAPKTNM